MAFDINKLRAQIETLQQQFIKEYKRVCDLSYSQEIASLPAGSTVPAQGKIYGNEYRDMFVKKAAEIQAEGYALIDQAKEEIRREMAAAPEEDTVAYIEMLSGRDSVSEDEILAAVENHGGNYAAYQRIREVAGKNGAALSEHPLDIAMKDVNAEISTVRDFTFSGAENGFAASSAALAFKKFWNELM